MTEDFACCRQTSELLSFDFIKYLHRHRAEELNLSSPALPEGQIYPEAISSTTQSLFIYE